jgi:hypothetical protein
MGEVMSFESTITEIDNLDPDLTIYVEEPWTIDSKTVVEQEPEMEIVPKYLKEHNFSYFLEVFLVQELKSDLGDDFNAQKVIDYAINDA